MSKKRIIGFFDDEEKLISAIGRTKEQALVISEIFMPYPVHEAISAVGKKTKLPRAGYFLGLFGAASVLGFLYYTSVIDWPIMYGGKPFNSFPSFIVVTIVLTILTVTIGSLFLFSVRAKLFPGKKEDIIDPRASDDQFAIVMDVEEQAGGQVEQLFKDCGAIQIR